MARRDTAQLDMELDLDLWQQQGPDTHQNLSENVDHARATYGARPKKAPHGGGGAKMEPAALLGVGIRIGGDQITPMHVSTLASSPWHPAQQQASQASRNVKISPNAHTDTSDRKVQQAQAADGAPPVSVAKTGAAKEDSNSREQWRVLEQHQVQLPAAAIAAAQAATAGARSAVNSSVERPPAGGFAGKAPLRSRASRLGAAQAPNEAPEGAAVTSDAQSVERQMRLLSIELGLIDSPPHPAPVSAPTPAALGAASLVAPVALAESADQSRTTKAADDVPASSSLAVLPTGQAQRPAAGAADAAGAGEQSDIVPPPSVSKVIPPEPRFGKYYGGLQSMPMVDPDAPSVTGGAGLAANEFALHPLTPSAIGTAVAALALPGKAATSRTLPLVEPTLAAVVPVPSPRIQDANAVVRLRTQQVQKALPSSRAAPSSSSASPASLLALTLATSAIRDEHKTTAAVEAEVGAGRQSGGYYQYGTPGRKQEAGNKGAAAPEVRTGPGSGYSPIRVPSPPKQNQTALAQSSPRPTATTTATATATARSKTGDASTAAAVPARTAAAAATATPTTTGAAKAKPVAPIVFSPVRPCNVPLYVDACLPGAASGSGPRGKKLRMQLALPASAAPQAGTGGGRCSLSPAKAQGKPPPKAIRAASASASASASSQSRKEREEAQASSERVATPASVSGTRERVRAHASFQAAIAAAEEAYTLYLQQGNALAIEDVQRIQRQRRQMPARDIDYPAEDLGADCAALSANNNDADEQQQQQQQQENEEAERQERERQQILELQRAREPARPYFPPSSSAHSAGYHVQVAQVFAVARHVTDEAVGAACLGALPHSAPLSREAVSGGRCGDSGPTVCADAARAAVVPLWEFGELLAQQRVWFVGTSLACKPASGHKGSLQDSRGNYLVGAGDHIAWRYEVCGLLGQGTYAAVYQCRDASVSDMLLPDDAQSQVAIKVTRDRPELAAAAAAEVQLLLLLQANTDLERRARVVPLLNYFSFRGHRCLAFPFYPGGDLYSLLKADNFQGKSMAWVRRCATQLFEALAHLHAHGVVHCDVKPENVLVKDATFPDIVLADLGSAFLTPPAGADAYGEARGTTSAYAQSRFYRAPEVILRLNPDIEGGGPVNATGGGKSAEAEAALTRRSSRRGDYSGAVDVWSVAAMLPELRTGHPSFAGESERDQLHCIAEVLGTPPAPLLQRCPAERRREFFTEDGEFRVHMTDAGVLREPGSRSFAELSRARKDKDEFCSFLQACLRWQSRERPTPEQALCLPWLALRPSAGLDAGGEAR